MSQGDFSHVAYHKVFENEYAVCELEEMRRPCDGAVMYFLHARLARWTPRIFRECQKNWHKFRTTVPHNIFASPQVHGAKWERFVSSFGFVPLIEAAPCNDGIMRPIWINYGQQQHHQSIPE